MPQKHVSEGSGPQWKIAESDRRGLHTVLGGGNAVAGHSLISQTADKESKGAKKTEGMPVGVSSFRKLRDNDMYFVDKSMFIDQILKSSAEVTLITRPRRFGKSINLDMTDCYLNIKSADEPDRFKGLKISEERPNDPEKNSNHIIAMSFKALSTVDYPKFEDSFRDEIIDLYEGFMELDGSEKLTPAMRRRYSKLVNGEGSYNELTKSIMYLCEMIEAHHGKKPIILIDEYDNPMNNAFGKGELHERIVGFLREVLSNALKDNESLRFAVLTGVMKISQESIFSGLNNPKIVDVFSTDYDEMFGFTQDEVEWLLRENGHEDKISEAKEWYDGYRFGDEDVYNPWSIISYIDRGCFPKGYWESTSGNDIIRNLVSRSDQNTWMRLETLCTGKGVSAGIKGNIAYCDLQSTDDTIFSVMVASGYLKAVPAGNEYLLSVPNKEVLGIFKDEIISRFGPEVNATLLRFIGAMKSGNTQVMTSNLRELMESLSQRILTNEFPYEAFIAGLAATESGKYEILADHEAGNGYYDIRMKRIAGPGPNILIEIKRRNEGNKHRTMVELAREALGQIHDNQYAYGLKGETMLYGIAFDGKIPTILMERSAGER